jgi:hypothetical protein
MENGKTGNRVNRSKTQKLFGETRRSRIPPTSSGGGSSAVGYQPILERTVQQTRTQIGLLCFSVRYDFSRFYFGILSIYGPPRPEFVCWRAEEVGERTPRTRRMITAAVWLSRIQTLGYSGTSRRGGFGCSGPAGRGGGELTHRPHHQVAWLRLPDAGLNIERLLDVVAPCSTGLIAPRTAVPLGEDFFWRQ